MQRSQESMFHESNQAFDAFSNQYLPLINEQIENYLKCDVSDNRTILNQSMLYSLNAGGKRIRPLLMIASSLLFTTNITPILPLAVAMEMIHTYSLIHDDLPAMDNDDYRRGKLTCHKKYGEDMAILAGDTLNTFAFEICAKELSQHFESKKVLEVISELAKACGVFGMVGGQVLDLSGDVKQGSFDDLKHIHSLKTGALLKSCVVLPAILHDADQTEIDCLSKFGDQLGLLFQIVDDILDVTADAKTLGKTPQKDVEQGKLTYVSLLGLEGAKEKAEAEFQNAALTLTSLKRYNLTTLTDMMTFIYQRTY